MAGKLQLNDLVTTIAGKIRGLFAWPIVCLGMNGNVPTPMAVDSSGNVPTVPAAAVGTYVYFHVGNSASLSGGIPVTAKRWAVNFIGTGVDNTFGTNTAVTGGQGFSDNASPAALIAIACTGATVADGFYSTT